MNRQAISDRLSRRSQIAFDMIREAAEIGGPAPTNTAISWACGYNNASGGVGHIIKNLSARNLVRHIKLSSNSRQFVIVATGQKTDPDPPVGRAVAAARYVVSRFKEQPAPQKTEVKGITLYTLNSEEMREAVR